MARPAGEHTLPRLMAGRALEYWLRSYRGTWKGSVVSGFLAPLLYLGSLGFGLGVLVDAGSPDGVDGVPYLRFVAPGVLVATAMQTAVGESTHPVMAAIVWRRLYFAMLATPLRVIDVLLGHLAFIALRLLMVTSAFAVVGLLLGVLGSWWLPAAVAVAVLCGLAHAAPVMAFAARLENDYGFAMLYRLAIVPMFLFAGTFFPVEQLPGPLRLLAWVTPLWHGTEAVRALVLSRVETAPMLGHLTYLALWTVLGTVVAAGQYRRRLAS